MYLNRLFKPALISVLSFISQVIVAQDAKKILAPPSLVHSWWVQFNPLGFAEPEVAVAATVLYKQNKHVGFALDAGVFIARQDYNDIVFYPYSGFRLKPAVKFYLDGDRKGPRGFYFSLQGLIKRTGRKKQEWLSLTNNGQPVFNQLVDYKERKMVYGLSILFGGELVLGKQKRWMMDFYAGLGVKSKKFEAIGLPQGFSINYDNRDDLVSRQFDLYQNGTYINMPLGFKIAYRVK